MRNGEKIEANRRNRAIIQEWREWKRKITLPPARLGPSAVVEPAPGGEALEAPALDGEAPAPGGEAPAPGGESPARDCQEAGEHAEAESLCQSSDKGDLFRTRLAELEWSAKTKLKNHLDHEREAEKTQMPWSYSPESPPRPNTPTPVSTPPEHPKTDSPQGGVPSSPSGSDLGGTAHRSRPAGSRHRAHTRPHRVASPLYEWYGDGPDPATVGG